MNESLKKLVIAIAKSEAEKIAKEKIISFLKSSEFKNYVAGLAKKIVQKELDEFLQELKDEEFEEVFDEKKILEADEDKLDDELDELDELEELKSIGSRRVNPNESIKKELEKDNVKVLNELRKFKKTLDAANEFSSSQKISPMIERNRVSERFVNQGLMNQGNSGSSGKEQSNVSNVPNGLDVKEILNSVRSRVNELPEDVEPIDDSQR